VDQTFALSPASLTKTGAAAIGNWRIMISLGAAYELLEARGMANRRVIHCTAMDGGCPSQASTASRRLNAIVTAMPLPGPESTSISAFALCLTD
jgi:hypothetical protein